MSGQGTGRGTVVGVTRCAQPPAAGDAETVYQRLFLFGDWETDELFGSRSSMEFSGYDSKSRLFL